jgi:formate dehydrogenase subunit delta
VKHNKMIAMANQIAMYFHSYPEDRAVEGVATHIKKFWSPNMRERLRTEVAASAEGVDVLVLAAIEKEGRPEDRAA